MATRAQMRFNVETFYEDQNFETVASMAPLQFNEEFIGAGHSAGIPAAGSAIAGYPWVKKITGAAPPTVAILSNVTGGVVGCSLLANNEAEEASLFWGDSLSIDTTKIGNIEFRAQLAVLPSTAGVQAFLGLGSVWVGGPQNLARYLGFGWSANGALLVWAKDGVTTSSIAAAQIGGSAITTDTAMHTYRISYENPADIAFYVDGNRVNTVGSINWQATGSNAILQPWMTVYKTASTGLATLNVDKLDIFSTR